MKIAILNALGNETLRRCIDSLLQTTPSADFDLHVFRERDFRERTLNFALSQLGTKADILFVGDDIEFTPGWYEGLMRNYSNADILGLSMLYPNSTKIQDRGYDLVNLDGQIILEACDRSKSPLEGVLRVVSGQNGWRYCDALCGCFMMVKADVFKLVPKFREAGGNRFGEFIFASEARHKGAQVAVIDHYLYHHGHGTKSHADKVLSSNSYQIEKPIWEKIARDYVSGKDVRLHRRRVLDESLKRRLSDPRFQRILFYGVGTVTEFILANVKLDSQRLAFCSGLPEEAGTEFHGQRIQLVGEVELENFDWIVITPLHIGKKIFSERIQPRLSRKRRAVVSLVEAEQTGNDVIHKFRDLQDCQTSVWQSS
jgi:hypothetical protein